MRRRIPFYDNQARRESEREDTGIASSRGSRWRYSFLLPESMVRPHFLYERRCPETGPGTV